MKTEQMQLEEIKIPEKIQSCVFTGHREVGEDLNLQKLQESIDLCISRGAEEFYCGMAKGFDLLAAEEIIKRKNEGKKVKLIACIPYKKQASAYSEENKKRYEELLQKADKIELLNEEYRPYCLLKRDEFMVEQAEVMIAYCNKEKGGTAYTVKYFKRKKKGYIFKV